MNNKSLPEKIIDGGDLFTYVVCLEIIEKWQRSMT
jgi:hypothetical protein